MAAACDEPQEGVRSRPSVVQFLSHEVEEEHKIPIKTKITGTIPDWLTGSLHRVGPGKFTVGPYSYKHWFDGLAVLHRFSFTAGEVCYRSQFLKSEAYNEATSKSYIAKTEFGTASTTNPGKSLLQRFMALFDPSSTFTDNCNVNLFEAAGEMRATTETGLLYSIDRETLDTGPKTVLTSQLPIHSSSAHPHTDPDGTIYNIGTTFIYKAMYEVYKIPPKPGPNGGVQAKPLGTLIASYPNASYYHSFGMTENYFILLEQPIFVNLVRLGMMPLMGYSLEDTLYLDDRKKTVIRVFCRRTGKALRTKFKYTADPSCTFHHVNAFEEDGHIVFDVCSYSDHSIIKKFYFANLESPLDGKDENLRATIRRFVLPTVMEGKIGDDLNRLPYSSATAVIKIDGSLHCTPEIVFSDHFDYPAINYALKNGKKYKYAYGVGGSIFRGNPNLTKVNVQDGSSLTWREDGCYPSEPVFVPHPEGETEDAGVILSLVIRVDETDPQSFLLVLDAANFKELGRATINEQLPATLHGIYRQ